MLSEFTKDLKTPQFFLAEQKFEPRSPLDVKAALSAELEAVLPKFDRIWSKPKAKIAVGVGSRGITNLVEIARMVVAALIERGADPYICPAMGSHGGATSQGQEQMLAKLGITEESVGAPVIGGIETEYVGDTEDGIPMFNSRQALNSDGIILINRVKAHTGFVGPTESGILKMMAIGLGNQVGADHYHRLATVRNFYEVLSSAGRTLIKKAPFMFGVAIVEDQEHQTNTLRIGTADEIEDIEKELLVLANRLMPKLPVDNADLLIVDEIGKNISGAGLDPNVVGRSALLPPGAKSNFLPTRIFIRDVTDASRGMVMGMGVADFILDRLLKKADLKATAINALTACCPEHVRIPLSLPNDAQAFAAALMVLRPHTPEDLRIVHIKNTLDIRHIAFSQAYLEEIHGNRALKILGEPEEATFDEQGMFNSPLHRVYPNAD